jgi:hypothetical protein
VFIIPSLGIVANMYFIMLIVMERTLPQHTFLIMCLCFLPDDGWMEWSELIAEKKRNEGSVFRWCVFLDIKLILIHFKCAFHVLRNTHYKISPYFNNRYKHNHNWFTIDHAQLLCLQCKSFHWSQLLSHKENSLSQ